MATAEKGKPFTSFVSKLISFATGIDKAAVGDALSNGSRMMLTGLLQITTGQNNYLVSLTSDVIAAISDQTPKPSNARPTPKPK